MTVHENKELKLRK